jgi:hypothetical protein
MSRPMGAEMAIDILIRQRGGDTAQPPAPGTSEPHGREASRSRGSALTLASATGRSRPRPAPRANSPEGTASLAAVVSIRRGQPMTAWHKHLRDSGSSLRRQVPTARALPGMLTR